MNYSIEVSHRFKNELKRLVKKYPSLKKEFAALIESLKEDPEQGNSLGQHCYKIRLAISSKGKGKSGGARVITYVYVYNTTVYMLSIYDKSEKSSISNDELKQLLSAFK